MKTTTFKQIYLSRWPGFFWKYDVKCVCSSHIYLNLFSIRVGSVSGSEALIKKNTNMLRLGGGRRLDARRRKVGNPTHFPDKVFCQRNPVPVVYRHYFFNVLLFFFISWAKRRKIGNPIPQIKFFASVSLFLFWKGIVFLFCYFFISCGQAIFHTSLL